MPFLLIPAAVGGIQIGHTAIKWLSPKFKEFKAKMDDNPEYKGYAALGVIGALVTPFIVIRIASQWTYLKFVASAASYVLNTALSFVGFHLYYGASNKLFCAAGLLGATTYMLSAWRGFRYYNPIDPSRARQLEDFKAFIGKDVLQYQKPENKYEQLCKSAIKQIPYTKLKSVLNHPAMWTAANIAFAVLHVAPFVTASVTGFVFVPPAVLCALSLLVQTHYAIKHMCNTYYTNKEYDIVMDKCKAKQIAKATNAKEFALNIIPKGETNMKKYLESKQKPGECIPEQQLFTRMLYTNNLFKALCDANGVTDIASR